MQSAPKMNHALIFTIVLAAVYSVAFSQTASGVCRECWDKICYPNYVCGETCLGSFLVQPE